jgi:hypothetical protein
VSGRPWVDDICPAPHGICSEVESEKFVEINAITLEEPKIVCGFIQVSGRPRIWSVTNATRDVIKGSGLLLKCCLNARK